MDAGSFLITPRFIIAGSRTIAVRHIASLIIGQKERLSVFGRVILFLIGLCFVGVALVAFQTLQQYSGYGWRSRSDDPPMLLIALVCGAIGVGLIIFALRSGPMSLIVATSDGKAFEIISTNTSFLNTLMDRIREAMAADEETNLRYQVTIHTGDIHRLDASSQTINVEGSSGATVVGGDLKNAADMPAHANAADEPPGPSAPTWSEGAAKPSASHLAAAASRAAGDAARAASHVGTQMQDAMKPLGNAIAERLKEGPVGSLEAVMGGPGAPTHPPVNAANGHGDSANGHGALSGHESATPLQPVAVEHPLQPGASPAQRLANGGTTSISVQNAPGSVTVGRDLNGSHIAAHGTMTVLNDFDDLVTRLAPHYGHNAEAFKAWFEPVRQHLSGEEPDAAPARGIWQRFINEELPKFANLVTVGDGVLRISRALGFGV
ncbi:MAG: DUF6232 family protein [Pseudomonadota bacterium]